MLFIAGCSTTGNVSPETNIIQSDVEEKNNLKEVVSNGTESATRGNDQLQSSDAGTSSKAIEISAEVAEQRKIKQLDDLNQQIALASINVTLGNEVSVVREDYKIGPGDVIEIAVFQVEDLNKIVRVTGDGYILLPLLGAVKVIGKTTTQIQNELVVGLAKDYLHDPQVTVFVSEYRSHQVAVLGAVIKPDIYNIEQPRTVLEMLSKAGGLSEESGTRVRIQRTVSDEKTGLQTREAVVLDLQILLTGENPELNFILSAGDSLMVPKAGNVFIEGAVAKPGAYQIKGNTNVLKALALAGGVKFEAVKSGIQIFRQIPSGESIVHEVDLNKIRSSQSNDFVLEDGDIVVVRGNNFKKGMAGFWKGLTGIFSIGTSI